MMLADSHGVAAFDHYDELLASCDAVVFAMPPAPQQEYAAMAARRGKAVLLSRPIAPDYAGAWALVEELERHRIVSQVALVWRFAPAVRLFLDAEVPATEAVGGRGRLLSATLAPGAASAWRIERGVLKDEGADLLDLLDAALGPIVGVQAHGDPRGSIGLLLEHQVGRTSEASLYASGAPGTRSADVQVYGPGGSAEIDPFGAETEAAHAIMLDEFVACVDRGQSHEIDGAHGLHLQQVLEAAEMDLLEGN
jgi:predicted dehydrogenase